MKLKQTRHTKNLSKTKQFYTNILGLDLLGTYENENGYKGIFLGKRNQSWLLEFTISSTLPYSEFDKDDLLVFYPDNETEFREIMDNIKKYDIKKHEPNNPYWKEFGIMIKDPDGFGIIIKKLFNNENKSLWTYEVQSITKNP